MAHPDPQPIPELKSGKRSKAPTSRRSQPGALKQEAGRGSGLLQVRGKQRGESREIAEQGFLAKHSSTRATAGSPYTALGKPVHHAL